MGSREFSWLNLALEVRILTDVLIRLLEKEPPLGQMNLFSLTIEERKRFEDLAITCASCLKSDDHSTPASKWDLPFYRYEMFGFVREWTDATWKPYLENMARIGNGEPLDKELYLKLISFFGNLEGRALSLYRHRDSKCF